MRAHYGNVRRVQFSAVETGDGSAAEAVRVGIDREVRARLARSEVRPGTSGLAELIDRDRRLDRTTAYMLGSRTLIIVTAMRAPHSDQHADRKRLQEITQRHEVWMWTLDAFFLGADKLISAGFVPDVIPVPDASWLSVDCAN